MIHLAVYRWLLTPALTLEDIPSRRQALFRWVIFAVVWQVAVLVAIAAYGFVFYRHHPQGLAWVAPALGAVAGTALPLQVAAFRIARATRL